ncbi:MAG TPA: hypothetical protein VN428_01630 [Bryobacteraceae bacterium]|nr:hypothetical protein [Bryobacteraceae bacterium]
MIGQFLTGVKRFILWDYPRASWQYDVMVGLILAFLFLTPREWFRDQPRIPGASRIARLQAAHGTDVYWIESAMLDGVAELDRPQKAAELLGKREGRRIPSVRLEPVRTSEHELTGYLAFAQP